MDREREHELLEPVLPAPVAAQHAAIVVYREPGLAPRRAAHRPVVEGRIVIPTRRTRRRWKAVAIGTATFAAGGAFAGFVWLIITVVQFVIEHAVVVAGAAVLLALLLGAAGKVGICPGIHCPGCRHR